LLAVGAIVLAFMVLSLAITATGTARFAMAMGCRAEVGYAVGTVFDLAKALLPIALLILVARRAFFFFVIIGVAWLGLVTYSALATHATVSAAIGAIERSGSWKMEVRSEKKAELDAIQKRLGVLSQPAPPRPSKTLVEALTVEKVPPGVWRDSQECQSIRDSKYFQTACAKVLELRRELAVAQDYEQLDVQARELRQVLAGTPLVATSDPLPEAFAATLGRLLPLDGRVGVALLLTLVIEIMSCFGLASLRALREERGREDQPVRETHIGEDLGTAIKGRNRAAEKAHHEPSQILPISSLMAANTGVSPQLNATRDKRAEHPSNIVPISGAIRREPRVRNKTTLPFPSMGRDLSLTGNHVPDFARECLEPASGTSLSASELRATYEAWCTAHDHVPLSRQKLGADLTGLGFAKWKSCGLIRYRDLQLIANCVASSASCLKGHHRQLGRELINTRVRS
jgi:hypothetical protein